MWLRLKNFIKYWRSGFGLWIAFIAVITLFIIEISLEPCSPIDHFLNRSGCLVRVNAISIRDMAFTPDGGTLVTGSTNGNVRLWQIDKAEPILSFDEEDFSTRIAISADGIIFATSSGTSAKVRQVNNGELIRVIGGYRDVITDIDIAPNGTILAVAVRDYQTEKPNQPAHRVDLWRIADGKIAQTLQGPSVHVQSVAFSPDGTKVATSGGDSAWIWQVNKGTLLHTLKGHIGEVDSVAFSPDGKILATGSWGTIKLWQVNDGMLLHTLRGHLGNVLTVGFSPDGKMIASGGEDGAVNLWQVENGEFLRQLKLGFGRWVWNVSFSPDGAMLATASGNAPVRIYEIQR